MVITQSRWSGDLSRHFKHDRLKLSKHERLLNLVTENCSAIAYEYNQLMDMSSLARYKDYVTDRAMSNKAKAFHKKIQEFCEHKTQ